MDRSTHPQSFNEESLYHQSADKLHNNPPTHHSSLYNISIVQPTRYITPIQSRQPEILPFKFLYLFQAIGLLAPYFGQFFNEDLLLDLEGL